MSLPGPPAISGAGSGFAVFLLAQLVVTPTMGRGFFSGGKVPLIAASLRAHPSYGAIVGAVYGRPMQLPSRV